LNLLTPEVTIEECAEVIQAITKIKRFGFENSGYNNKQDLEIEIGQLKYMLHKLILEWELDEDNIWFNFRLKKYALEQYAVHNVCNQPEPTADEVSKDMG